MGLCWKRYVYHQLLRNGGVHELPYQAVKSELVSFSHIRSGCLPFVWCISLSKQFSTDALSPVATFSTDSAAAQTLSAGTGIASRYSSAPGALILGGAHGSLALARGLGRQTVSVWFATHDHPLAGYSRYVRRYLTWPGPNSPDAVASLIELARQHELGGWVLFPGGDAELRLLSQHHDELSTYYRVAAPVWSVAQWMHDKRLTQQHAERLGIAAPLSFYPENADDVAHLACTFPVILKPTVHDGPNAFTRAKAWRADDRATLIARYNEAAALVGSRCIVIQELIPGGGESQFSYAAVWQNGHPLAALVARRTRQYPLDFGYTSTFVETTHNPHVQDAAEHFLATLDFSGLVEIEFKHDARDAKYKLLDVNARVWAWASIGEAAGLDFPGLAFRVALGARVAPVPPGRDATWVHSARNTAAMALEFLHRRASPSVMAGPERARAFAAFAWDDPLPGVMELPSSVARLLGRRWRGGARS